MTFFESNVYLRPCSVISHLRPSRDRKKVAILSFFEAEAGNEVGLLEEMELKTFNLILEKMPLRWSYRLFKHYMLKYLSEKMTSLSPTYNMLRYMAYGIN